MGLVEEVRKVLAAAGKLKGPAGNEANTKALLIEPMLAALGWDVTDVDHVVRALQALGVEQMRFVDDQHDLLAPL